MRARRLSGAICIGIALGLLLWIVLPTPHAAPIRLFVGRIVLPGLSEAKGLLLGRGMETVEQKEVSLLFLGDIMLDRRVAERSKSTGDFAYPFSDLPVGWMESFDEVVANLEGPVTDKSRPPVKSIDFRFDPSVIPILKAQGIDAVSQANNHSLDQGALGYGDSLRRLRNAGLLAFGHQVDDGPIALATTTVRGKRIAFLGFNTTDNELNREQAADILSSARAQADIVIAFLHWGTEYRDYPDASSVETAHWLIDEGVDAVVGAHPHWAQGISSYQGKPIVWSLGNFIFDQDWSDRTRQGLAAAFLFDGARTELELFPIQIDESRPHLVEGGERGARLEALAALSDESLRDQIRAGKIGF